MGGCQRSLNIASPEDDVTLIFAVAYRIIQKGVGSGGMLTFIAVRHQKMLLR